MEEREGGESSRAISSVKAAINKYGGKINLQVPYSMRITQKPTQDPEKMPSKASELHIAKKKIDQLNQDTKMAEFAKSQAELELVKAKKTVKALASQIEELKLKAEEQNKVKPIGLLEDPQYEQVAKEVEALKQELSQLKLDMARVSEEKSRAEKEAELSSSRLESYMSSAEQLRREIEDANEEEVLVELAQIQARKELAEVEAQRKEEKEKFSSQIEQSRKRICILREQIDRVKHLEEKLEETNSDVEVLQNELNLIREMDKKVERKSTDVQSVVPEEDVEHMKKELGSIQGEAFQLMFSMDAIRNELKEVVDEKERMQKLEEETENSIKNMNLELLRARDKLEAVSMSDEKERSMISSLALSLENFENEKEAALKDRESAEDEIASIRMEIQKTETETDVTEDRLSAVMQELTAVKSAEAKALKKLKAIAEKASKNRSSASKKKSKITITRFEYDYLSGCAIAAREVAEKKMAAAHAWAEALKASEREMKIRIELAEREVEDLKLQEEEKVREIEESLKAKQVVEGELLNQRKRGTRSLQGRKLMRESRYSLTPVRQANYRRSLGSPTARRLNTSDTFNTRRRRKVTLKITKYFADKQVVNEKGVSLERDSE